MQTKPFLKLLRTISLNFQHCAFHCMPSLGFPLSAALTNTCLWWKQGREIDGSVEWSSTNKSIVTKIGSYSYHFLVLTQFPALPLACSEDSLDDRSALKTVKPLCKVPLLLGIAVWKNNGWEQGQKLCDVNSLWSLLACIQSVPAVGTACF